MRNYRNIAIVWDFDGTLTPNDSTSAIIDYFQVDQKKFWKFVHKVNDSNSHINWEKMLSSDAPTWMYVLSRIAFKNKTPLTEEFFKKIITNVKLYPDVESFLKNIKKMESQKRFKDRKIKIHQFIVTAGLKEYVELLVPKKIFSNIWGGRYSCVYPSGHEDDVESVPVFCMDETMKTRALYEISKGVFTKESNVKFVNKKVEKENLWCPFNNFIYIGDGPTDIPALSLTRVYGGYGIVVFDPAKSKEEVQTRLKDMSADSRCDLITKADFSSTSALFSAVQSRCCQILQKYEAEDFARG